jgi:hypothetical protein
MGLARISCDVIHFGDELIYAIGVCGVRACVTRGIDAGSAAQCRDYQSGVVGQHNFFGEVAVVQGFAGRVFREGGCGFFVGGEFIEVGQGSDFEILCRSAGGEFGILA